MISILSFGRGSFSRLYLSILGTAPKAPMVIIVAENLYSLYSLCISDISGMYLISFRWYASLRLVSNGTVISISLHVFVLNPKASYLAYSS